MTRDPRYDILFEPVNPDMPFRRELAEPAPN